MLLRSLFFRNQGFVKHIPHPESIAALYYEVLVQPHFELGGLCSNLERLLHRAPCTRTR